MKKNVLRKLLFAATLKAECLCQHLPDLSFFEVKSNCMAHESRYAYIDDAVLQEAAPSLST